MTAKEHFSIGVRWLGILCLLAFLGIAVPQLVALVFAVQEASVLFSASWIALVTMGVWGAAGFVLLGGARRIADRLFPPDDVERAFGSDVPTDPEPGESMFQGGKRLLGIVALLLAVSPLLRGIAGGDDWGERRIHAAASGAVYLVFGILLLARPIRTAPDKAIQSRASTSTS